MAGFGDFGGGDFGGGGGFGGGFDGGGGGGGFGGGDAGGGGFESGMGGGFGASPSGGGVDSKRSQREKRTMVPLTIKQLLSVQTGADDTYTVDGREVHQVCVVGCIASVESQATHVGLVLEDSTGSLHVNFWTDGEDEYVAKKRATWVAGAYVRVIGQIKFHGGAKPIVVAYDIKPVTDHNEVTHHNLSAIFTHLQATKGIAEGAGATASAAAPAMASAAGGMDGGGVFGGGVGAGIGGAVAGFNAGGGSEFDPVQQAVLDVFRQAVGTEEGMDVRAVQEQLAPRGIAGDAVWKAVEFLSTEGHLYSTIDETHFQSTM
mmetsp:Transcript_18837/g.66572  ORF Transcript_18837/g.66572 Transcript_18837/m.66572 type:complete len:318 (-) Transcript_18837:121-1074(-)